MVEHIPLLLWKFSVLVDPRGNVLLKGNHWNASPCAKTGQLARVPSNVVFRLWVRYFG